MALPDSIVVLDGTQIILADTTDHAPAAANDLGTRTDQIDLTSVADSAYRQSTKIDFGANRAPMARVIAALEFAATPTAGEAVYLYFCWSESATAANGNVAGTSGSDSAYTGYSSNADDSIKQAQDVLICPVTSQATGTVQILDFGDVPLRSRYCNVVFRNESGAAMHSDMVESSIAITPHARQVQD